ncbi:hypothetical protein AN189_12305 [Loktanella sp. 3ANDIMAR09]|uniref:hypothetical protein n=1 Tax=Loktanella sp. 3ANDIMAR09 TaxID=1225657 RepID=UPI0007079EDA|nr:hypothetical protein [Loktanella sp. 3ANDIMAR09]KQI68169.1 hypothetical protein AN189_12305 [Loktanella sp. 3ANDIMAR09]
MRTLTACLILTLSPAAALAFPADTAKQKCEAEWAGDFEMQAYCMDQQRQGWQEVEQQRAGLDNAMSASLATSKARTCVFHFQKYMLEQASERKCNGF